MKIYTRKGDSGETSLFGGQRVSKHAGRIEAYGTVDELNSILGFSLACSPSTRTTQILKDLQQQLFVLGADLATPSDAKTQVTRIGSDEIEHLESVIDELEEHLTPLKNFILPGGGTCGATLHMARTVCRRAERAAVGCLQSGNDPVTNDSITYLNRLSDLLFVLARFENHQSGQPETKWERQSNKD